MCANQTHEWTHVETAVITFAAGTVLKGMQEHQEISTPSNVRRGLLRPAHW
jgi:hypothetical protein